MSSFAFFSFVFTLFHLCITLKTNKTKTFVFSSSYLATVQPFLTSHFLLSFSRFLVCLTLLLFYFIFLSFHCFFFSHSYIKVVVLIKNKKRTKRCPHAHSLHASLALESVCLCVCNSVFVYRAKLPMNN